MLATLVSPTFTGVPNAPTAAGGTNTVQIATTAFVATATSTLASLASPTFTGTPAAPTATSGTSTTQLATTAFVTTAVSNASSITNGNTSATVTDTGSNGAFTVTTEGLSRLIINSTGAFGISGSSFGTSGQVFTSAGSEAAPTWQTPAPGTKIIVGNTYAEVGDTGADGTFNVVTEGNSRLTINSNGAFGLGGANYGTADQVLISNGSTSPPSWQSLTNTSIAVGNTNATVTDTGSDGAFTVTTEGVSRLTVNSTGLVSLSGNLAVTGTTAFTGIPTGPTAANNTNTTQLATTAFVATAISSKANLASPAFTGVPTAPSAAVGTNTTQIATTAFVDATADLKADIAGPTFTGIPKAPTAATGTNTTQIATTAFVEATADLKANIASPTFTGTVVLPTETSVTASSQPALVINSTAITSWKSLLAFSKSGIRKWEIGVDPTGAGNNVLYFKDDVASLERARINPTGYLKISPTGTYQDSVSTTHEINGGTTTSGSPLMLRQLSLTTAPWYVGPYNATGNFWIYNSSGIGMYIASGAQVWTGTSDERLKTIIEPISNALNKVSSLRAVIGRFNVDPVGTRRSFLIAQDVQAVLPEAVDVRDDEIGTLGLAYSDVIPLLVAALKESLVRIQELESKVTAFKTA